MTRVPMTGVTDMTIPKRNRWGWDVYIDDRPAITVFSQYQAKKLVRSARCGASAYRFSRRHLALFGYTSYLRLPGWFIQLSVSSGMPATVEIREPLTLAPLPSRGLDLCCPKCGATRLHVSLHESVVPGGGVWLNDGDTIPGLHQRLADAGKLYEDISFDCALLFGFCPACESDYFVVEAIQVAAPIEFESNYADVYFHMNGDRGQETNLTVLLGLPDPDAPSWLVRRFDTPKGPLLHHCLGPFPDPSRIGGPFGVMACGTGSQEDSCWIFASNLLFSVWDAMVDLTRCIDAEAATSRSERIQASPSPDTDSDSSSMEHPETLDQLRSAQRGSDALASVCLHELEPGTGPASSGNLPLCESTGLQSCESAHRTKNESIPDGESLPFDSSAAQSHMSQDRYTA